MENLYYTIKTASVITDRVVVAFSGGKDSVVTLDLCKRYFKHVNAFFMYLAPDLSFQEAMLKHYERQYNLEILRIPHPEMTAMLAGGAYRRMANMPVIGFNEAYDFARNHFKTKWVAAGERINDSLWRRGLIKSGGTICEKRLRIYPVAHWTEAGILAYIKHHKLKLSPEYRAFGHSMTGISPDYMYQVKRLYPADFERIKTYYPDVEVAAALYQKLLSDGELDERKTRRKSYDGSSIFHDRESVAA